MHDATAVLRTEHEAILGMLAATGVAADRLERGEAVPGETLGGLLEFFQLFADRCHHGKEEDVLFPLLEQKGIPRGGGPIGVMLAEHDQGRGLIRDMAEAERGYRAGAADAGRRWAAAARAYTDLLQQHIAKENQVLFVMAERVLTDAEQQRAAADFERIELEKMGAGTHERLHARMATLHRELGTGR
jgi:hemerythrin-like domain-containing protein